MVAKYKKLLKHSVECLVLSYSSSIPSKEEKNSNIMKMCLYILAQLQWVINWLEYNFSVN